jgi:2'-5' RNA ligase
MANVPMPDGLSSSDLECVMLDVGRLDVHDAFGPDIKEKHFFYGDIPELKYAQGPVAEDGAHVTLLFGIHPSETYVEDVMNALDGWVPEDVLVRKASYFPSNIEGQDYKCIVLEVVPTANLLIANQRLQTLPHTNNFEYRPHITLAYIKGDKNVNRWLLRLNAYFAGRVLTPTALNLGLTEETPEVD